MIGTYLLTCHKRRCAVDSSRSQAGGRRVFKREFQRSVEWKGRRRRRAYSLARESAETDSDFGRRWELRGSKTGAQPNRLARPRGTPGGINTQWDSFVRTIAWLFAGIAFPTTKLSAILVPCRRPIQNRESQEDSTTHYPYGIIGDAFAGRLARLANTGCAAKNFFFFFFPYSQIFEDKENVRR